MNKEDLLKRRYKVNAPNGYHYPNSPFKDGEILIQQSEGVYIIKTSDGINSFYDRQPENYPHLFELLPWYAERDVKDMPEYVSYVSLTMKENIYGQSEVSDDDFYKARVFQKVDKWELTDHHGGPNKWSYIPHNKAYFAGLYNSHLPATEAEYLSYINSKTI